MNKYLSFLLIMSVLIGAEGCRRRESPRSAGSTVSPLPAADSTGTVRRPAGASADSVNSTNPTGSAPEVTQASAAAITFRYLTARSKISFRSAKQELDNASVTIRIQQDSLIWVSISKLGIEGARVLITRDSIKILDKINRAYAVSDFTSLSRQFAFRLDFSLLQALMIGNRPFPDRPALRSGKADDVLLRQNEGPVLIENYLGQADYKLKKLIMTQTPTRNTLRADYADFTALNSFLFPFSSVLTLDYQSPADGQTSQTVLRSQYSKVELIDKNPGFPFTVPAGYQRRP